MTTRGGSRLVRVSLQDNLIDNVRDLEWRLRKLEARKAPQLPEAAILGDATPEMWVEYITVRGERRAVFIRKELR